MQILGALDVKSVVFNANTFITFQDMAKMSSPDGEAKKNPGDHQSHCDFSTGGSTNVCTKFHDNLLNNCLIFQH